MRGEREEEVRGGGGGGGGLRGERAMTLSTELTDDSVKDEGGDEEDEDEDGVNCGWRRTGCGDDVCIPSSASLSSWFQFHQRVIH